MIFEMDTLIRVPKSRNNDVSDTNKIGKLLSRFQWCLTYVITETSCLCTCHRSQNASVSQQHLIFIISSLKYSRQTENLYPHALNSPEIYSVPPLSRRRGSSWLKMKQNFSYKGDENFLLLEQASSPPYLSGHLTTPAPSVCLPTSFRQPIVSE